MKTLINELFGKQSENQVVVPWDAWFKAFTSVPRHLSHLSPAMNFETFSRHATNAICQGLIQLQPVAAHLHIDVSVSHLWLPDPSFKIDVFYRLQNRVLMPSQTRPVETSREELFRTHVIIPFELHKHAIEILVYHKEQPSPASQQLVTQITESFSTAVTQAMSLREEHMLFKEIWEKQAENVLGRRLGGAIYQAQSPFVFAQTLRGFSMPSSNDSSEHLFLHHNPTLDLYRFIFLKINTRDNLKSSSRTIALVSSLAAQLRFFEHTSALTSFSDLIQYFSQCISSLAHLLTENDEICFTIGELARKSGLAKWHCAGMPVPLLFGNLLDLKGQISPIRQPSLRMSAAHDWSAQSQQHLPAGAGLFFTSENISRRLNELNLPEDQFYERLQTSVHAANIIIEAENILSKPNSTRVVSSSVTDWSNLAYDISMLAMFNAPESPKS